MEQFKNIITKLSPDLKLVDETILNFSKGKSPLIQEIANHLISSGGKRIRPVILILAAKLCGSQDSQEYTNLAAAVEMIHTATLLHDDVVDNSTVRRGKKTSNALWDNKASILVGDYLFSVAFQLMVLSNDIRVLDLLAKTSSIMADGEVMQLENSCDIQITQEKYFEIIYGKTAVLFSAAAQVGALVNKKSQQEIDALKTFGKNLGMLFQIADDMIDYSSSQQTMGKDLGNDFFEGKVTLPIILTYQNANEADRQIIKDLFEANFMSKNDNPDDLKTILNLLEKYDSLDLCKKTTLNFHKDAVKNLEIFPDFPEKQELITILDYAISRIS